MWQKTMIMSCLSLLFIYLRADKITYLSIEHPSIYYVNYKYVKAVNISAFRFGRSNPVYYVNINFHALDWFGNNLTVDIYFYEFLTNRYQRSFVEMHFKFCDLIHKDMFFGPALKQGKLDAPCPYAEGEYNLANMTVLSEAIPRGFPFKKGRFTFNLTIKPLRQPKQQVFGGQLDMELKSVNVKNRIKGEKL